MRSGCERGCFGRVRLGGERHLAQEPREREGEQRDEARDEEHRMERGRDRIGERLMLRDRELPDAPRG